MEFKLQQAIEMLQRTPQVVETLLSGLSESWVMNNEGGETWSPYNIIGHYIEGEKHNWIPRMQIILSNSGDNTFKPFDRLAQLESSKGKTLDQLLQEFKQLRKTSLQQLQSANISDADLDKTGTHPQFGTVTLKQLLATWVVHDLSHINQISRVMVKQYATEVGPWAEFFSLLNTNKSS